MEEEDLIEKKIVVVGDGAVGKTCLLWAFGKGSFPTEYIPTVMDEDKKKVQHGKEMVMLKLCDTAGGEYYDLLRPSVYQDCHVVIMAFSLVSRASFNNIISARWGWYTEYQRYVKDAQIILVGTKQDLVEDPKMLEKLKTKHEVPVTSEEGKAMAKSINAFCYRECSALTQFGVQELLKEVIKAAFFKKNTCCII